MNLEEKNLKYYGKGKKMRDLIWEFLKPRKKYKINKNDYLRIGKLILKLKNKNLENFSKKINFENFENFSKNEKKIKRILNKKKIECVICKFLDNEKNPFLNLCKCSLQNPIHLNCIKKYIFLKIKKKKNKNFIFLDFEKILCPICKFEYPLFFLYKNEKISLLDFNFNFKEKFAIFEIFDKDFENFKGFLILFFNNQKKFNFGRNEKNDIIFKKNFISRFHLKIFLENENLYVEDLNSKFGTFFLFFKPIFPKLKNSIFLQIDRFFFIIHFFYLSDFCFCFKNNYVFLTNEFQNYYENKKKKKIEKNEKNLKIEKIEKNLKIEKIEKNLKFEKIEKNEILEKFEKIKKKEILYEKQNNINFKSLKHSKFLRNEKKPLYIHYNEISNNESSDLFFNTRILENQKFEFN